MNRARAEARSAGGFTTIQYVTTAGLSLVFLVLVANLLVDMYARAVVRDALDEGARAAIVPGSDGGTCEARAREVLDNLLRGPIGNDIEVSCAVEGEQIVARAVGTLPSWLPMLTPDWSFEFDASALREDEGAT